jgi:hypothetical protein
VLYRFKLTDDGHPQDITPITGGSTPALVAGLAISPDGRRIAYATAPCGDGPERSLPATTPITLAVLDSTGQRRTWTSSRPTIVGHIVWAGDSRTVGYTTGEVTSPAPPTGPPPTNSRDVPRGVTVGAIQVRALHTEAPGTDLLAGRVLFGQSDEDGTVNTAVMARDGRTGFGVMHKGEPPSTVMFTFSEGQPMRVTSTIPADPKGSSVMVSLVGDDEPPIRVPGWCRCLRSRERRKTAQQLTRNPRMFGRLRNPGVAAGARARPIKVVWMSVISTQHCVAIRPVRNLTCVNADMTGKEPLTRTQPSKFGKISPTVSDLDGEAG